MRRSGTGRRVAERQLTFQTAKALSLKRPATAVTTGLQFFAEGNQVFYGFDGQNGSYSNQYMHYMDDGLFVGQFGEATDQTYPSDPRQAQAGNGGNVGYMSVVKANGRIYLYHVDEAMHAGVHRWRVDNLDSIQDQSQYLVY